MACGVCSIIPHLRASYVRDHATYIDQIFLPNADHAKPTDGPSAH
jgi:hypothetical protein